MSTEESDNLFLSSNEENENGDKSTEKDQAQKANVERDQSPQRKSVRWGCGVKPSATISNLVKLFDAIKVSKDKLIFIKFRPQGATSFVWAVVQIDLEETDERRARKKGICCCRWFSPHPDDRKHKSVRVSRF